MIEIELKDGRYVVRGPKLFLVLTREQFIAALKRGKAYQRQQALAQRLGGADESPRQTMPRQA
jgi:hypothetical protein